VADPSIAELPFVDDVIAAANSDLDASGALLQRLLAAQDALLATALTAASLFTGIAFTSGDTALAFVGIPLVLALGFLDAINWVHFRRVSTRIRSLEHLIHHYVVALRETGTVRAAALRNLRRAIDRYQFGIERTLQTVSWSDIWRTNRKRVRWWLYGALAVLLAICGGVVAASSSGDDERVCIEVSGGVAQVREFPRVTQGTVTVVSCPKPSTTLTPTTRH